MRLQLTRCSSSAEAAHIAQCASIYRFSNDGLHFEAKIVDSQKMTQLKTLSRHRKIFRDIVAIFVIQLCCGLQCYVVIMFYAFFLNYVRTELR